MWKLKTGVKFLAKAFGCPDLRGTEPPGNSCSAQSPNRTTESESSDKCSGSKTDEDKFVGVFTEKECCRVEAEIVSSPEGCKMTDRLCRIEYEQDER